MRNSTALRREEEGLERELAEWRTWLGEFAGAGRIKSHTQGLGVNNRHLLFHGSAF